MSARLAGLATVLTVTVVAAVIILRSTNHPHHVRAVFANATNLLSGLEVRVAGRKVGEVSSRRVVNGRAVLDLRIDDARVWPIRRDARATIRYGTTISTSARYVELDPGTARAPAMSDGALLAQTRTVTPVEFDQLFNVFERGTRRDLKQLIRRTSRSFADQQTALSETLRDTPGGLRALADLLHDLGAEPSVTDTLVTAGNATASAIASRDSELRPLLDDLAASFDTLATQASSIAGSLDRFPTTLSAARATLARTDHSLSRLDGLTRDLAPAATRLRELAPVADEALQEVDQVAPLATATLRQGSSAAPATRRFLAEASPFVRRLKPTLDQGSALLSCVRPYGPEVAGFLANWAGFTQFHDSHDHYMRILLQASAIPNGTPESSRQVVARTGLGYQFPAPPGRAVGQPWLLSACSAGADALDSAKDPERRP